MKLKLLFSVVFACTLLTTSYAQINKGAIWLGSNFSYSQSKERAEQLADMKIRTTSIFPAFGVAIKENLVLGIYGNYSDEHRENNGVLIDRKEKKYGGGLFIRRYVPVFNRFYIFGEGRLGYNSFETKNKWSAVYNGSSDKTKGWETGLTFTPGISYGITQHLQLEAGFTSLFNAWYRKSKSNSDTYPNTKSNSFTSGVNLENASAFTIGFRFLINKKA
jgi:opacity protein-like surface antigen